MLRAILNKSWRQHPTRHQLYGHLPPITKTIQVRRTRHRGHCWRSRDELISDVLLWTPTHGRAKAGRPARTYIQQLCEDTGYCPEDLPEAMNDREKWRERVRGIRATSTTWWWWFYPTFFRDFRWIFENIVSFSSVAYIHRAFNKFPDFFCTGIWNCRRLLKIQYVIVIHIMRWQTNFDDFRLKKQLQYQLEYTILKPDCQSWCISKMQSWREDTLEEQYAIKLFFKHGKTPQKLMECFLTILHESCTSFWVA